MLRWECAHRRGDFLFYRWHKVHSYVHLVSQFGILSCFWEVEQPGCYMILTLRFLTIRINSGVFQHVDHRIIYDHILSFTGYYITLVRAHTWQRMHAGDSHVTVSWFPLEKTNILLQYHMFKTIQYLHFTVKSFEAIKSDLQWEFNPRQILTLLQIGLVVFNYFFCTSTLCRLLFK